MNVNELSSETEQIDTTSMLEDQLALLESSEHYITFILAALFLQLKQIGIQKEHLTSAITCQVPIESLVAPNTAPIDLTSSLLIIYALRGFYEQAQEIAENSPETDNTNSLSKLNPALSGIAYLIAIIRYLQRVQATCSPQEEDEIPAEIELEDPVL